MSTDAKTPPVLYTSPVTGEINCPEHAPRKITDTWWRNRWRKVSARDRAAWPVEELGEMRCEVCRCIARNAARTNAPSI
jgi:hypothetical protein